MKVIDQGKISETLNEVKPVENINKNLQGFLEINSVKRKYFPHINCKTMYIVNRVIHVCLT